MSYVRVSKAMEEVHKWREEIYNETKGMPIEKKLDYFHRACGEIKVKFKRANNHKNHKAVPA